MHLLRRPETLAAVWVGEEGSPDLGDRGPGGQPCGPLRGRRGQRTVQSALAVDSDAGCQDLEARAPALTPGVPELRGTGQSLGGTGSRRPCM